MAGKPNEAAKLHRRKKKQLEALRKLLQFQVNKIYTMQRICKHIYVALVGLHAEVCKLNATRTNWRTEKYPKKDSLSKSVSMDAALPHLDRVTVRLCF